MEIMLEELTRAYTLTRKIRMPRHKDFFEVCDPAEFSHKTRHFLVFYIQARTHQIFSLWSAWCIEQFRMLVPCFEKCSDVKVTFRPWPNVLECTHSEWPFCQAMFVGLRIKQKNQRTDDQQSDEPSTP